MVKRLMTSMQEWPRSFAIIPTLLFGSQFTAIRSRRHISTKPCIAAVQKLIPCLYFITHYYLLRVLATRCRSLDCCSVSVWPRSQPLVVNMPIAYNSAVLCISATIMFLCHRPCWLWSVCLASCNCCIVSCVSHLLLSSSSSENIKFYSAPTRREVMNRCIAELVLSLVTTLFYGPCNSEPSHGICPPPWNCQFSMELLLIVRRWWTVKNMVGWAWNESWQF